MKERKEQMKIGRQDKLRQKRKKMQQKLQGVSDIYSSIIIKFLVVGLGKDSFSSFLAARYNNAFTLWLICKASFMSQLPGTLPQETAGLYLLLILHPCLLSAAWELVSPSQTTSYGWQTGELGRDWIPENFVKQSHDIRPRSLTTSLLHERKINFYLI